MNDSLDEFKSDNQNTTVNSARIVQPLSEDVPTTLSEALAQLEASRIQCIELKIMLDAAENYVSVLSATQERERQAQKEVEDLQTELESERAMVDKLRAQMALQDDDFPMADSGDSGGGSGNVSDLTARVAELETTLKEERTQHELAIAAQLREIQRSTEAEQAAVSRLKGLEHEYQILQTRASMLAKRSDPETGGASGADKPSGLMGRLFGRSRRSAGEPEPESHS